MGRTHVGAEEQCEEEGSSEELYHNPSSPSPCAACGGEGRQVRNEGVKLSLGEARGARGKVFLVLSLFLTIILYF